MPNTQSENVVRLPSANRAAALARGPRTPAPAPALVPFARWQTARDRVAASLLGGNTRLLITGPAGTGKTLLLDGVARVLRAAGWTVVQQLADMDVTLVNKEALLVDEADRLPPGKLQTLLQRTDGPVVLAGLPVLERRVPSDVVRVVLAPLEREEARDFIAHWLTLTGRTPAALDTTAMLRIVELSGGIPRLISLLLGASSWLAQSEGETAIHIQQVDEAAALRACFTPTPEPTDDFQFETGQLLAPRRPARWLALGTVMMVAVAGIALAGAWRLYPLEFNQYLDGLRGHLTQLAPPTPARTAPASKRPPQPAPVAPQPTAEAQPAPAPPAKPLHFAEQSRPASPPPPPMPATSPPPAQVAASSPELAPPPAPELAPMLPSVTHTASAQLPPEMLIFLVRRGREMMTIGDISAARLLFGRAAEAGDAAGMLGMALTYDPAVLANGGSTLTGDAAEATNWYRRAEAAGSPDAATFMRHLSGPAAP